MTVGPPLFVPRWSRTVRLGPGDTVVLLSDGFPELFDARGEMLGYDAVAGHVRDGMTPGTSPEADGSAEALIAHLQRVMERWAGDHPLLDDVTFLVLQMKPQEVDAAPSPTRTPRAAEPMTA